MDAAYAVRRNALEKPTVWTLTHDALVETRPGKPERHLPLATLKTAKLASSPAGYGRRRHALALVFAHGRASIGSHSFAGLTGLSDQTPAFSAFARKVCAAGATAAPGARFLSGAETPMGAFGWSLGLLGAGIVTLVAFAASAGALSLGLDLAARLAFVLCLLLALRPWMRNNRGRSFDPRAIPAEVLP